MRNSLCGAANGGLPSAGGLLQTAHVSAAGVVCFALPPRRRRRGQRRRWPGALALLVCSAVQPLPRERRGQLPLRPVRQVLQERELVAPAPVLPAPVAPAVPLRVLRQVVYDQVVSGPAHPERPPPAEQGTVRPCRRLSPPPRQTTAVRTQSKRRKNFSSSGGGSFYHACRARREACRRYCH